MNPLRRSLVSLLIIAIATLATWGAWRRRPPPPPPPGAELTRVLPFAADQVARVSIHGADGALDAARAGAGWRLERLRIGDQDRTRSELPPENEVAAVVGDLIQELVQLPEIDRFPLAGQDLASFGLHEPRWRLDLTLADGEAWTLQLGGGNVAGTSLYATVEHTRTARAGASVEILQLGTLVLSRLDSAFRRLAVSAPRQGGES